jgi:hypothetical protein
MSAASRRRRRRHETPAARRARLSAELDAAQRESRPPAIAHDDVTDVLDLTLERVVESARQGRQKISRCSHVLTRAARGFRAPQVGGTDVVGPKGEKP